MISRDLLRAVLETRDHRHNEAHGALLMLYQALICELVANGALSTGPLADRLDLAAQAVPAEPRGDTARDLLAHVVDWLRREEGHKPMPRWELTSPVSHDEAAG